MRTVPDFVLRGAMEQLEEAQEWLATIDAPEKKAVRDLTPVAVTYWIVRAKEIVAEVTAALNAFDIALDDETSRPEDFRPAVPEDDAKPHEHDRIASADAPDKWSCQTCPADWRTDDNEPVMDPRD